MKDIDKKVIDTIRFLSVDAIERANSGHPGLPMGAAPMAYVLWSKFLKKNGKDPNWVDRDRFILSAGHGSMLLYSLLHLFGYDLPIDDIKEFRQWGSRTPGHPEYGHTPGVETTTGPLGQGFANGVGMAIGEKRLAAEFNVEKYNIVDHYTYVLAGDGDLMEGISSEAASLAGHLKLGKLIVLYDDNNITIDGETDIAFTEDVGKRFEAYGWQTIYVKDGNNLDDIGEALKLAKENTHQPSIILVSTVIGYGSPNKAGTSGVHGSPLGKEEAILAKKELNWDIDNDFYVPNEVKEYMEKVIKEGEEAQRKWEKTFEKYSREYPQKAKEWKLWHSMNLDKELENDPSLWRFDKDSIATRAAGRQILNTIAKHVPNIIGGSADLNASTKTYLKNKGDFNGNNPLGNNIAFGVREHAMAGILNGIALHGGFRSFGSTFLVFSDYMKPSIRLSALMKLPVIYVFTHDSIGVGEDGPTHQPVEQLMALRTIPNVTLFRPGDAKETSIAWVEALKNKEGPSILVLTRQNLPVLEGVHKGAHGGAYILREEEGKETKAILMGTGSEVSILVKAYEKLKEEGIDTRVVSIPSMELFNKQPKEYKENVLPSNIRKRISLEAGSTTGWKEYLGDEGIAIGLDSFGASAPGDVVMEKLGFTVENVVERVKEIL